MSMREGISASATRCAPSSLSGEVTRRRSWVRAGGTWSSVRTSHIIATRGQFCLRRCGVWEHQRFFPRASGDPTSSPSSEDTSTTRRCHIVLWTRHSRPATPRAMSNYSGSRQGGRSRELTSSRRLPGLQKMSTSLATGWVDLAIQLMWPGCATKHQPTPSAQSTLPMQLGCVGGVLCNPSRGLLGAPMWDVSRFPLFRHAVRVLSMEYNRFRELFACV
mmetsp:Transcript_50907/g.108760  ORF Transcript_50907/g.108760 Transcript_50907/m.108760 type:complete len:219 (+) Transcript_50907:627-1283(+)